MKSRRSQGTILEHPPAYDPQSNGAEEKAVQEVMEQLRALKIGLEQRLKQPLDAQHAVLEWCLEHSGLLLSRYKNVADGRTAYRRLMG